jgi:predicted alpha/beta hydrolase
VIETMDPRSMTIYAQMCGKELARAHARSGDPVAIASYLGASDVVERSLADFAELYADQNESDFAALQQAVRTGRVAAQTGV